MYSLRLSVFLMIVFVFAVVVYFPASGVRFELNGGLASVGNSGRYWASSSFEVQSGLSSALNVDSGTCKLLDALHRSVGRSVRCVQELTIIKESIILARSIVDIIRFSIVWLINSSNLLTT